MTIWDLIANHQPLIRCGLHAVIANDPDLRVVGETGARAEAVRMTWPTPVARLAALLAADYDPLRAAGCSEAFLVRARAEHAGRSRLRSRRIPRG